MNFINDQANVCKTFTCGDRLKAEKALFWLVSNSFQIHGFMNHFSVFSIIVQVASCEQTETNRKPIEAIRAK